MKYLKKFERYASDFDSGDIVKYTETEEVFRSKLEDYEKTLFTIKEVNIYTGYIWIYDKLNYGTQRVSPDQIELATDSEIEEFRLKHDMKKYNL